MERFLAVYAHEDEAMDIEPIVLPVTYSSRKAFLNWPDGGGERHQGRV